MPARRLFLAFALVTLASAAAVMAPVLLWIAWLLDVALLVAFGFDFGRGRKLPLQARRLWPPVLVQGGAAEVEVTVTTTGPSSVVVALREGLHPAVAERPLRQRLHVVPGKPALWRFSLVPRRRGNHELLPLTARVLGPWQLAWAQRDLLAPETVRVYPQIRWEGRAGRLLALAHRRELGLSPISFQGVGSEPYAVRRYVPGDPPNRIHWKATARHGHLITREDTWERGSRLVILLDCGRSMASMDAQRSKLDYALSATLALTRVAAARGDRVTIVAFSDRVERRVRVRPDTRGASHAYASLYDLEARLTEPAYDLAAEAAREVGSRQAIVVLLTSLVDLASAELLRETLLRLRRRHRSLLVNLEDPELARLAVRVPVSALEAFAKVSALEILLANRRLAARLRHSGIRAVTTSADRLAVETLDVYLGLLQARGGRGRGLRHGPFFGPPAGVFSREPIADR